MKKTIYRWIAVLVLAIMMITPAYASDMLEAGDSQDSVTGQDIVRENGVGHVEDNADIFTEEEEARLKAKADKLSKKYNVNIAIYTDATDIGYYSNAAEKASENAYLKYYKLDTDGIILYLNMTTRDYMFTCSGKLKKDISYEYGLAYLEKKVKPKLSDGQYYKAFDTYLEITEDFVKAGYKGHPYSRLHPYRTVVDIIIRIAIGLVIGAIIAAVHVGIEKGKLKSVRTQPFAKQYVAEGGFDLNRKKDTFMYKNVTKSAIPKNTSSGGSGGVSRSSGGSFSSRGGKF